MTEWQMALDQELQSWLGTPWVAGQQLRGRGVDCVHFVVSVLDQLHGLDLPPIPRLPQDLSLHDRDGAMRAAFAIARRYPNIVVTDGSIEPGDVLVKQLGKGGGPGHVLIAGCRPGEIWHASIGVGVVRTSIGMLGETAKQWRPTAKETWCRK